jgi:hypothetical protein
MFDREAGPRKEVPGLETKEVAKTVLMRKPLRPPAGSSGAS